MYILPKCTQTGCVAQGTYFNDDGINATLDGNANVVEMEYEYDLTKNDTVLIRFNQTQLATSHKDSIIGATDYANQVEIFNA
jgi:hypothetical protein